MSRPSNRPRLQSWIPASFVWATADVFCVEVSIDDTSLVEFIATGTQEITVSTKEAARVMDKLMGRKTLLGQLQEAVSPPARLKPKGTNANINVTIYCYSVFLLPDENLVCAVAGGTPPSNDGYWISSALKSEADVLLRDHQAKVAEFDKERERKTQEDKEFYDRLAAMKSDIDIERLKIAADVSLAMKPDQRPVLTAVSILPLLPRAVTFEMSRKADPDKIAKSAVAAIAASSIPPSRDGTYAGILPNPVGRKARGIVSWIPHDGLTSYPEIRWAVQRRLPSALSKPRSVQTVPPEFDSGVQLMAMHGFDPSSAEVQEALQDLQLDQSDFSDRVDNVRKDIEGKGYEAIAWFQPYHSWAEDAWGIYFDARKLDDFACSLFDDLRARSLRSSHGLAAYLAFGLIYAHELFHARVEAALSWLEISALQPKHARYQQRVYAALRETPEWLEEALANWSSWGWFKSEAVQTIMASRINNLESLDNVITSSLDLSPPGYRDWRLGEKPATWSKFATQLSTASPKLSSPGIGLPIKSMVTGPLPYDFQLSDIPLHFVGEGVIASLLQSHPATFNVPSRREVEKALKLFGHELDPSSGKGGHQKWTGPDQRAFTLPTRDPVSLVVFRSFLHHVGIDKNTYVLEVRPKL